MKETYKVLGSMLALREFTAKDLEDYSGVTGGTVHTVLNRRRELLEELGVRETKRRGGQLKVYRLHGDRVQTLEEEIGDLIKQIRPAAARSEEATSLPAEGGASQASLELPLSLLAGEEALLALFPNAKTSEEKQALLSAATSDLESGRYEVDMLPRTPSCPSTVEDVRALMERVQALKDLAEAEVTVVSGLFNQTADLRSVFDHLFEAMQYSSAHGDEVRADLLKERILNSPLFGRVFGEPSYGFVPIDGQHRIAALKGELAAVEVIDSHDSALSTLSEEAGQLSAKHHIAVLHPDDSPGEEYLQHGVTSGIARSLSHLPNLAVKSPGQHSPSGRRKEEEESVQALGERLGVRTVLSSMVEAAGNGFRCLVRLFDTGTGKVWEKQYDEASYISISKVGAEVSKVVASLFSIPISSELEELLGTPSTHDPEAQRLYMEGRYHWNRCTSQGFTRAIQCYEKALSKDLAFSLAYAGQADCYNVLTDYTSKSPRLAFKKAREAACVALVYDTALADAYASLAYSLTRYYWDWPKAEAEFLRALTINPNYTLGHQWFAEFLTARRRFDEAVAQVQLAQELEPDSLTNDTALGTTYFFAKRYGPALSQFEHVLRRDPRNSRARFSLGIVHTVMGNYDQALRHLKEAVKVSPNSTRGVAALGYTLALSGQRGKAREILDGLLQKSGHQFISRYSLAPIHIALGEKDAALSSLEEAVEQRDPLLMHLNVDPRLDDIREASRFRAVAAGVGVGA